MSIHTDKAFHVARAKGAAAGRDYRDFCELVSLSKRELIEAALHLAAITTDFDSYDDALESGDAHKRVMQEIDALRANRII